MALPVIITNYSGPTAYANDDNSYLIPVKNAPNKEGFVEPDVKVLISLMKDIKENPQKAKEKGRLARETMKEMSPKYVAGIIASRLRGLAKMRGWED